MASINKLRASDGSGNASVATVQSTRSSGASTIIVDTVQGINTNFYGTMGTPHTFTDPITNETITVISEATAVDFAGHVDGSNLEIDTIAPGYTDNGSNVGDIVIIRPTTQWANEVADVLNVAHNDDGTIKNDAISSETMFTDNVDPVKRDDEMTSNFVASGGIWTGDAYGSTRNASMTALVAYINGQRGTVGAVTARSFTASKDTYVDVLNTNGVFSLVYTEVANNAASPPLAANSIRIATIVTGASSIADSTSIGQGGFTNTVPVISGQILRGFDSLGNIIYPKGSNTVLPTNPYKFSVYCSTGKPVYNTTAKVDFQTKVFDTNNNFDTSNSRYIAPVAGFYQINAQAWWGSAGASTNEYASIHIRKNGSATGMPESDRSNGSGTGDKLIRPQIHQIIQLAAGDYIELWIDAVGSRDLVAGQTSTYMSGFLVSAS